MGTKSPMVSNRSFSLCQRAKALTVGNFLKTAVISHENIAFNLRVHSCKKVARTVGGCQIFMANNGVQ
jgi:hypothetical protein